MLLRYLGKVLKLIYFKTIYPLNWIITYINFEINGVKFHLDYISRGFPIINVNLKGKLLIGKKFTMHSGTYYNMIGRQQRCFFIVGENAEINIGDNVGVSCISIVSHCRITIKNDVRIGGGVAIYDTDFHPLSFNERLSRVRHKENTKSSPVEINEGAFIGAHSLILKGVSVGKRSIIGAGSVVTRSIPDDEIWGGNPAKFIRKIDE